MAFGQYGQNEMLYAKPLVERITDRSLTVFDRGFLCAEILLGLSLAGEERRTNGPQFPARPAYPAE